MTPSQWLEQMRKVWLARQPDEIAPLLADTLVYFEDPTKPPLTSKEAVVAAWQDIVHQNI